MFGYFDPETLEVREDHALIDFVESSTSTRSQIRIDDEKTRADLLGKVAEQSKDGMGITSIMGNQIETIDCVMQVKKKKLLATERKTGVILAINNIDPAAEGLGVKKMSGKIVGLVDRKQKEVQAYMIQYE